MSPFPATAPPPSLLSLPCDALRIILVHLDFRALCAISETGNALHDLATSQSVWKHLARRRFRVNPRSPLPRRMRIAGTVSWRTIFANWHALRRMPLSRTTGPSYTSFARGETPAVRLWLCVSSADDCRLRNGALRLRLIIQNIAAARVKFRPHGIVVRMADHISLPVTNSPERSLRIVQTDIVRTTPSKPDFVLLLDEFAIVSMDLRLPNAEFEVDVLERLKDISIPIVCDTAACAVASFVDKIIWDAYDRLPGGCWVRRG